MENRLGVSYAIVVKPSKTELVYPKSSQQSYRGLTINQEAVRM